MKESFQKRSNNLVNFMRELGYEPDRDNNSDDFGFHRSIRRAEFPRFHLYVEEKEIVGFSNFIWIRRELVMGNKMPTAENMIALWCKRK